MVLIPGSYDYILDVPGNENDKDSPLGFFISTLEQITQFRPGSRMYSRSGIRNLVSFPTAEFQYGVGTFVETENGLMDIGMPLLIDLLDREGFNTLDALLRMSRIRYEKNSVPLSLCCEATTRDAQTLLFSNETNENLLYLAVPTALFKRTARVYVGGWREEDEQFEKALVRSWASIEVGPDWDGGETPPRLPLFSSKEEAQRAIDVEISSYLRKVFDRQSCKGVYVQGMQEKYRYPPSLTDEDIVRGENIVEVLNLPRKILREYSDGIVLVGESYHQAPLEKYFNRKEGVGSYSLLGCSRCCSQNYNPLRQRAINKAVEELEGEENLLVGPEAIARGCHLDASRLKVSLGKKRVIEPLQKKA